MLAVLMLYKKILSWFPFLEDGGFWRPEVVGGPQLAGTGRADAIGMAGGGSLAQLLKQREGCEI